MNNELLKQIKETSKNEPKTLEQLFVKWMEELGEASQALLSHQKVSGNQYKNLELENLKEELIDTLLVNLDIIYKIGMSDSEIENMIQKKINKWIQKQNK
ncbi:hypothetical protein [Lactococcus lactis]|uniref:hypothetical protein n=1 Tax=Lactococcus lactis TaxID=1358 RepID=UPI003D0EA666